MKKHLHFLIILLLWFPSLVLNAQDANNDGFHDGDVEVLKRIVTDNPDNVLEWKGSDYGNWEGVTWNSDPIKRVIGIHAHYKKLQKFNIKGLVKIQTIDLWNLSTDLKYKISDLDVSECPELKYLDFTGHDITNIDLSNNKVLHTLKCSNNKLINLDLSSNKLLVLLECGANNLKELNLLNNLLLQNLNFGGNNLLSIDLSNNTELVEIYCYNSSISNLDISNNLKLEKLYLQNTKFKTIDLSKNVNLKNFSHTESNITGIDISKNTLLQGLNLSNNKIQNLDISNNKELTTIDVSYNSLTNININNNKLLEYLRFNNNNINNIDISENTNLQDIYCSCNILPEIDFSKYPFLSTISFDNKDVYRLGDQIDGTVFNYFTEGVSSYEWRQENSSSIISSEGKFTPEVETLYTLSIKNDKYKNLTIELNFTVLKDDDSDGFYDADITALKKIITDNPDNTLNWEGTNYDNWQGVIWSNTTIKRVSKLIVNNKKLIKLDVDTNFPCLNELNCSDNKITNLDFYYRHINKVNCNNNFAKYINGYGSEIDTMICNNNNLGFSTLVHFMNSNVLKFLPQNNLSDERTIALGTELPLLDYHYNEENIKTKKGTYKTKAKWYKDGIILPDVDSYYFTPRDYGSYYAELTNDLFPGVVLKTSNNNIEPLIADIIVEDSPCSDEHETLSKLTIVPNFISTEIDVSWDNDFYSHYTSYYEFKNRALGDWTLYVRDDRFNGSRTSAKYSIEYRSIEPPIISTNEIRVLNESYFYNGVIGKIEAIDPDCEKNKLYYRVQNTSLFSINSYGGLIISNISELKKHGMLKATVIVSDGDMETLKTIPVFWKNATTPVTTLTNSTVNVYPNPSSGMFTVDLGNNIESEINVLVSNLTGNNISNFNYYNTNIVNINLTDYKSGMYILTIKGSSGNVYSKKITIK